MLEDIVQGSTMEYNLEMALMMEMEEMDLSQEYDWNRTEGLAEKLERMEISACMMDTTELITDILRDMLRKEEDGDMIQ
jgi:hypothetical protein